MKNYSYLVFLILLFGISCNSKKQNEITFSGQSSIESIDTLVLKRFLNFPEKAVSTVECLDTILIDNKGNFSKRIKCTTPYIGILEILGKDDYITIAITPEKDINLSLTETEDKRTHLTFESSDAINNFILDYREKLNHFKHFKTSDEYTHYVDSLQNSLIANIESIPVNIAPLEKDLLKSMVYGELDFKRILAGEYTYKEDITLQSPLYGFLDILNGLNNETFLNVPGNIGYLYNVASFKYERDNNAQFNNLGTIDKLNYYDKNFNQFNKSILTLNGMRKALAEADSLQRNKYINEISKLDLPEIVIDSISRMAYNTAQGTQVGSPFKYAETLTPYNQFLLEDLEGKFVYVDHWATWCGPCIRSIKSFLKKYPQIKDKNDIVFLFVSYDNDQKKWRDFIEENKLLGPNIINLYNGSNWKSKFGSYYNISGLPKTFLVDNYGKIMDFDPIHPSGDDFIDEIIKINAFALQNQ